MPAYTDIQRREVFHFLFLEQLLRVSDPKLYVLKGGVNLRFYFKSPRYSEDMDLDVLGGAVATLKKNGYRILSSPAFKRSLRSYGIADLQVNDPAKAKQTETTQRFRVRLVTEAGDSLPTKVEFSRRSTGELPYGLEKIDPEVARRYQRLAFFCQHYAGEAAVLQKVRALAGRDVTQARDVFDLGILHSGGHLNAAFLRKVLERDELSRAAGNLVSLDYGQFRGQVWEFLEEGERAAYGGEAEWEALKGTVRGILTGES